MSESGYQGRREFVHEALAEPIPEVVAQGGVLVNKREFS